MSEYNEEGHSFDYDTDTWKIFDDYFKSDKYRLARDQLDSYNDAIQNTIPTIIANNNPIKIYSQDNNSYYQVEIKNPRYVTPEIQDNNDNKTKLFPFEARSRSLSYMSQLIVDVSHSSVDERGNKYDYQPLEGVQFCKIPCMLQSKICNLYGLSDEQIAEKKECVLDLGGYFIVNGGEKVIVSQERVAENRVFIWQPTKNTTSKYSHECEIKSSIDQRFNPVEGFRVMLCKSEKVGKKLFCKLSGFKTDIPLFILMRALGVCTDKEIYTIILGEHIDNNNMQKLLNISCEYLVPKKNAKNDNESFQSKTSKKDSSKENEVEYVYTQDDAITWLSGYLNNSYGQQNIIDKNALVVDILNKKLLPHCGISFKKKAMFIGHMTQRLLTSYFGIRTYDKRDHYSNKRLNMSGTLLCQIFRTYYINHIKEIKKTIGNSFKTFTNKPYDNLYKLISSSTIESRLKYVLSTGNWGTNKNKDSASDKGVAQVLNTLSYYSHLSHIRRVHSPLEHSGNKIVEPRKLHATHYGMCCPNETPEGQQIGIVKNLAMQCKISNHKNDFPIRKILSILKNPNPSTTGSGLLVTISDNMNFDDISKCTKILVNGDIYGYVRIPDTNILYETMLTLKRHNKINYETSIAWYIEWNEIHIQTDGGRYMRPLHIVNENTGNLLIDDNYNKFTNKDSKYGFVWEQLITPTPTPTHTTSSKDKHNKYTGGCIEYLDTNEIENSMIAMTPDNLKESNTNKASKKIFVKYTHCEIHPVMMLSVVAQMIPFSDHNQAPRNIYQSSMGKQAIGYYCTNYNYRFDTMGNILVYGERPLTTTRTTPYTHLDKLPHGSNPMLLIGIADGYNQEDATVLNKDSVERGFFNTLYFRSYNDTETKHKTSDNNEEFINPAKLSEIVDKKIGKYDTIDDNGVPILGKSVTEMSAIIGKVVQIRDVDENIFRKKDVSTMVRNHEEGIIDAVIPSDDPRFSDIVSVDSNGKHYVEDVDGNNFINARVVQLRKPEIGDKFASRHSQKGVCGRLVKSVDMPFTNTGLVPDIIMNPHGHPSRMTQGKLLETLAGKIAVCTAKIQDGTPFIRKNDQFNNSRTNFEDILESFGFDRYGDEIMYDGRTGKMYEANFYYGPTYYQRLKHMVADKMHSRDTGPVQMLTRQPAEGRSRDGGLRLGEMERDALISHGVSGVLKESFMEKSDGFSRHVEKSTGRLVIANSKLNIYKLNGESRLMKNEVTEIQYPYSLDLGLKELSAIGIGINLMPDV